MKQPNPSSVSRDVPPQRQLRIMPWIIRLLTITALGVSFYSCVIFTSQQLRIGVKAGPLQVTSLQFLSQTADIDFLEKVAALCTESWKTALTCLVPWLGKTSDSDLIWTVSACNFISRTSLWLVNEALLDVEVLIFWHSCCPILAHLCLTYHINRSCLMLHSRPVWTHWGGSIVFFIHP